MNNIRHSVNISASKEKVWEVLWSDKTLRDWAGIIDPGTYMTGELTEGGEINFIGNSEGGVSYGVTNKVEKLIPNKYVLFARVADIVVDQNGQISNRESQWTGGTEAYEITELDDSVILTNTQNVPDELLEYFNSKIPEALERIKALAESNEKQD